GLGLFDEVTSAGLDAIEEFFFSREAHADHEISPLAGPDLSSILIGRGYLPIQFTSVLFLEIACYQRPQIAGNIEVRRATADQIPIWAATAAEGWAEQGEFTGLMQLIASSKGVMPFLAKIEGRPVATAALNIEDDIALLSGGSTIPGARHLGAQRALLQSRLWHAEGLGCRIAMMCAEAGSASQRNAEREGFRIAYTRTRWRRKYV
ncbi:MAG: hypothetical protein KGN84_02825, partial [Acidobacteriota bacterium]|nr:hypothetical protein [Acidobacteriota bacterium]